MKMHDLLLEDVCYQVFLKGRILRKSNMWQFVSKQNDAFWGKSCNSHDISPSVFVFLFPTCISQHTDGVTWLCIYRFTSI